MTEIKEVTERINTKSMWMFYVNDLHKDINKLKQEMGNNTYLRNKIRSEIDLFIDFIDLTLGLTVEQFVEIKDEKSFNNLTFKNLHIFEDGLKQKQLLTLKFLKYISVSKNLTKQQNQYAELKKRDLEYSHYAFILREFNLQMVDKIIEGYVFNLGYNIGEIKIKRKKRITARVNWHESFILKKRILEEHGVDEDANKTILYDKEKNPKGEKWIVKFTDDEALWVHWSKAKCKVKNKLYFSFIPVRGNYNNMVSKLHNYVANNPMVKALYD